VLLAGSRSASPFATFLFGIFGAIGLTLGCTGIFSVVSYAVSRRTREFRTRMALGATPGNVLRLVVGSTGRVLVVGFGLGAILSVVSSRALAGKLEGIGIASPSMLVAITSVLGSVGRITATGRGALVCVRLVGFCLSYISRFGH
jgi:ABC-type antimicrobial peptide transport system permease subunit